MQKLKDNYKTPIILLTGFLGAGKTTWLKVALENETSGDTAVLINEFGEIGIDHLLIDTISPDIVLLESGCACCQVRGELKEAILDMLTRRHEKTIPYFKQIIIETTGLAEPSKIFSTLLMDPILSNQTVLTDVVVIVDAIYGIGLHSRQNEWIAQVSAATQILLAKIDIASNKQINTLSNELSKINPTATISNVQDCKRFFDLFHSADRNVLLKRTRLLELSSREAHGNTKTISLLLENEIDWNIFVIWLSALIHSHGEKLLRVKCLLNTSKYGPILLDGVGHTLYPPQHIDKWPDDNVHSRLVFITRDLDTELIKQSFEIFVGK